MKAKFIMAIIAVITALAGWNINQIKSEVVFSELALANVEALARGEVLPGDGVDKIYHYVDIGSNGSPIHKYGCEDPGSQICPTDW